MKHRRWLSVILALCMLAGFVPAYADGLTADGGYDPADVYAADG